ncbi:hypothetical protein GCM10027570_23850 [Streptomonospora sediminis]
MTPPSPESTASPQSVPYRPQQGRGIAVAVLSTVAVLGVAILALGVVMFQGGAPVGSLLPAVGGGEEAQADGPSPSASAKPEPVDIPTPTADAPAALTPATVAGWKGVAVKERGIAYDVPGTWFVEEPGVISGFTAGDGDDDAMVGMGGVAVYGARKGPCYTYPPKPASTGISAMGEVTDTAQTAKDTAAAWAKLAYSNKGGDAGVTVGEAVPFAANGLTGYQATAEVQVADEGCYPSQAMVRAVSFLSPAGDDVFNFIIYSDTAGEAAPEISRFDAVVASLRPL